MRPVQGRRCGKVVVWWGERPGKSKRGCTGLIMRDWIDNQARHVHDDAPRIVCSEGLV